MNDPLDFNIELAGVETGIPVLKTDAPVIVQIIESAIEPNKDRNGFNWRLVCATQEPIEKLDESGTVAPNFKLYHTIALQARPDSKDPEAFRRSIGEATDAFFGTNKDNRPAFTKNTPAECIGKTCIAQLYNDEYPKGSNEFSTKIKRLKPMRA